MRLLVSVTCADEAVEAASGGAHIVDANDSGFHAPASIFLIRDRGDSDYAAAGGEDRSTGTAGRESEVGHDGMRLYTAHGP